MKKPILLFTLLAASTSAAAQPPFCAVTSMGAQCHFYSESACWQAVQGIGGQCVPNPAALQAAAPAPQVVSPSPAVVAPAQQQNLAGSFIAGAAAGQANRAARQQAADPWEQVNQHLEQTCKLCAPKITYVCEDAAGAAYASKTPQVGCVVAEVKP